MCWLPAPPLRAGFPCLLIPGPGHGPRGQEAPALPPLPQVNSSARFKPQPKPLLRDPPHISHHVPLGSRCRAASVPPPPRAAATSCPGCVLRAECWRSTLHRGPVCLSCCSRWITACGQPSPCPHPGQCDRAAPPSRGGVHSPPMKLAWDSRWPVEGGRGHDPVPMPGPHVSLRASLCPRTSPGLPVGEWEAPEEGASVPAGPSQTSQPQLTQQRATGA